MPGGDNNPLNQVLLQAPDVVQDSFGQIHVRADHNDLQYRLNGIILPEGISVFSQTLSPWLISSLKLITGALPAEYGLRTAGIIDLSTNSGLLTAWRRGIGLRRQPFDLSSRPPNTAAATANTTTIVTGRLQAATTRHRIAGRQFQSAPRSHDPGSGLRLFRGHHRYQRSAVADHGYLGRRIRNPKLSGSAAPLGST